MKLYGSFTSPFVRHCQIALIESSCAFQFIETDSTQSALLSPTKRVPFLQDKDLFFTDSQSIIRYVREQSGVQLCASITELDQFCLATTALDATLNLFFLERDGLEIISVPYLQRQSARIFSILIELNKLNLPLLPPYNDAHLRLACYMGWAKFRNRIDFSNYENLELFYSGIQHYPAFQNTAPS